jgi:hypothetical protein
MLHCLAGLTDFDVSKTLLVRSFETSESVTLPTQRNMSEDQNLELKKIVLYIQYSLLGLSAALARLNVTFRGLAPSPSSGKTNLTY